MTWNNDFHGFEQHLYFNTNSLLSYSHTVIKYDLMHVSNTCSIQYVCTVSTVGIAKGAWIIWIQEKM